MKKRNWTLRDVLWCDAVAWGIFIAALALTLWLI